MWRTWRWSVLRDLGAIRWLGGEGREQEEEMRQGVLGGVGADYVGPCGPLLSEMGSIGSF